MTECSCMQVDLIQGLTWTVPCDDGITATAAQLQHRLPCWGYVFREAGQPPLPDSVKLAATGASEVRCSAPPHAVSHGSCRSQLQWL